MNNFVKYILACCSGLLVYISFSVLCLCTLTGNDELDWMPLVSFSVVDKRMNGNDGFFVFRTEDSAPQKQRAGDSGPNQPFR